MFYGSTRRSSSSKKSVRCYTPGRKTIYIPLLLLNWFIIVQFHHNGVLFTVQCMFPNIWQHLIFHKYFLYSLLYSISFPYFSFFLFSLLYSLPFPLTFSLFPFFLHPLFYGQTLLFLPIFIICFISPSPAGGGGGGSYTFFI